MAIVILDPTVAANVAAAVSQEAQRAALFAPFGSADVTVRALNGATLRETMTFRPWVFNSATPRGATLGDFLARSVASTGAPTTFVFRAGSTDVFSMTGAVSPASADIVLAANIAVGPRTNLADASVARMTISANPALPVTSAVATAFTLSLSASTGLNGTPITVTVTPNGPIPTGGASVTLAASNSGTLGTTSLSFTSGSTAAQSTTLTRSTAGTSVVTMTNSAGLTNTGTGASYVSVAPVAPGGTLTTLTLSGADGAAKPFAVGHAFKQGDVPAGLSVVMTGASVNGQATIKSTWPDGSAKVAVLAGTVTIASGTASLALASGSAASGTALTTADLIATGITAEFATGGTFGVAAFGSIEWAAPFQTWASGPRMSSWVYRKQIGTDAHLVAWLEVRLFAGGAVEVLPWVENGYFNVASPTNKSATYSLTLGGTSRFSAAIDLPNHCRTPLLSGTALSYWYGASDPGITVKHDAGYMQATDLVPAYFATVDPSASVVTALPSTFTPLQRGSFPASMGSGGYDPSIGLLPEWDVLYLTSSAASVWAAIQRNAYSAGRYGIHHRDHLTNRPPRFSSYPTTVFGSGASLFPLGASSTDTYTPNATGTLPANYAASHAPSMGYMAYLVTGRFYHMETIQFEATANVFLSTTSARENASGIIQTWSGNLTRGAAWGVRTLAQALSATADSDTALRSEFIASMEATVNRHHTTYVGNAEGTLGWMKPYTNYTEPVSDTTGAGSTASAVVLPNGTGGTEDMYAVVFLDGLPWTVTIGGETRNVTSWTVATKVATVSPAFTVNVVSQPFTLASRHWYEATWMQDFYTAALGYMKAMNPPISAPVQTKLTEFFAWKAKSIVGRFGTAASGEFLYRDAAVYEIAIAESSSWESWYSDWGRVWTDTQLYNVFGGTKEIGDATLRGGIEATGYWANLQPALAYAVKHGVTGAVEARERMLAAPNWPTLKATFNASPVWSVLPNVIPSWRRALAPWQWTELTGAVWNNTVPVPAPTGNIAFRIETWSGFVVNGTKIEAAGIGGHGDYAGNEGLSNELGVDAPAAPTLLSQPSPSSEYLIDTDYYRDGKPTSAHTYYALHFNHKRNKILRFGVGSGWGTGNWSTANVDAFDRTSNSWDAANTWTDVPASTGSGYPQITHPITGDVYISTVSGLYRWNNSDATYTFLASPPSGGGQVEYIVGLIDLKRQRLVFLGNRYNEVNSVLTFSLANNTFALHTLTGSYVTQIVATSKSNAAHYHAGLDKYLVRCTMSATPGVRLTGGEILTVDPDTWATAAQATTGGSGIPNCSSTDSTSLYGRHQPVPFLGGDAHIARSARGVFFLATE